MVPLSNEPIGPVALGGVNVRFEPASPAVRLALSPRYAPGLNGGPVEARFSVHLEKYAGQDLGPACYTASNWAAYPRQDGLAFEFGKTEQPGGGYAWTVVVDSAGQSGQIYLNQAAGRPQDAPLELPPAMLDEVLAAHLLACSRGVVFHGCGIMDSPQTGYLFAGVSGSGKTTSARLWHTVSPGGLLSDERTVARRIDGQYRLFSTPWHSPGFQIMPGNAPLSRLFILEHAPQNKARRLGLAEAVISLLPLCYLPVWNKAGLDFTLEFLEDLCRSLPVYRLGFTPDRRAVEYVRGLARG